MSDDRPIDKLIGILAALRTPGSGCPWDLQQTHESLAPYAIEEAYELADAIARGDAGDMRDELGDCLLQVVFHAQLAAEARRFTFDDVAEAVAAKMLRRHPHVFPSRDGAAIDGGQGGGTSDGDIRGRWEAIKAAERAGRVADGLAADGLPADGLLADVPTALPGLTRAVKLQRRASTVGFDWDDIALVVAKIREEVDEVEAEVGGDADALQDEIGDLLFAVANLARHAAIDPEAALRRANMKFERRFRFIEKSLAAGGVALEDASLAEMEALWQRAKRVEREG